MTGPRRIRATALLAALTSAPAVVLSAQQKVTAEHVTFTLIPQYTRVTAGTTMRLALEMIMEPEWHVYFTHPGQSGIATRVEWTATPGVSIDSLRWPLPERLVTEGLVTHVYSERAVLFATVHLRDVTGPVTIGGTVTFGACQTQCVQGGATVSVTLPSGKSKENPGWQRVADDLADLPGRVPGISVRAVRSKAGLALWLTPVRNISDSPEPLTFFPFDPAVLDTCVERRPDRTSAHVALPLGQPNKGASRLRGILTGLDEGDLLIDVPISRTEEPRTK